MRKDGQADRRTDVHDKANSRFSQFCERTKKQAIHTRAIKASNLVSCWKWVVSQSLRPLYHRGYNPQYPWNSKLVGQHFGSGLYWREIKLLQFPGLQPRIVQPVAWSLYRLPYLWYFGLYEIREGKEIRKKEIERKERRKVSSLHRIVSHVCVEVKNTRPRARSLQGSSLLQVTHMPRHRNLIVLF